MRLLAVLPVVFAVALMCDALVFPVKRRRDSKWNVIHYEYHGPAAPLAKDGRVVETEEVAEARAKHLAIHSETKAELAKKLAEDNALDAQLPEEPELPEAEAKPEEPKEAVAEPEAASEPTPVSESTKEERPAAESEAGNEVEKLPTTYLQSHYEGPLAPLSKDGRVVDTPEVVKAKEDHLSAYEETLKLVKHKEESPEPETEPEPAWKELPKIHLPPVNYIYYTSGPVGYEGPAAPIDAKGRVVDTEEVERAKADHKKAHEHAEAIAKRNPPKYEDNAV